MASSSTALEVATAGLERLMKGTKPSGNIDHKGLVPKIASIVYYQSSVMSEIFDSNSVKQLYLDTLFNQINKDLSLYIDMQARSKPKELHHVYEWGKTGVPISRLFKLNKLNSQGYNLIFGIELRQSRTSVPNKFNKKYIFKNKAFVMESGKAVTVTPRQSNRLVFEIDGNVIFMPPGKPVRIANPGGKFVEGSLEKHYKKFVSGGLLLASIEKSGVKKKIQRIVYKAMKTPAIIKSTAYSYSPSAIKNAAKSSLNNNAGAL